MVLQKSLDLTPVESILKDGGKTQSMKRYSKEALNGKNISLKIVVISRIRVPDSSWKKLKI